MERQLYLLEILKTKSNKTEMATKGRINPKTYGNYRKSYRRIKRPGKDQ